MEVLDLPPVPLIGKCKRADKFFNGRTPRYLNQIDKRKLRGVPGTITLASALKENEDSPFLDFMQRALQWDPSARMTASEGLHHPWILRGHGGTRAVGDKKMVAAENARSMERVTNTRAMVNNFKSIVATGSVSSTMGSSGNSTLSSNSSSNFLPFPTKLPISKRTSTKMGTNLTIPRSDTAQMGDGGSKALHTLAGGRAFTVLPGWDAR